MSLFSSQLILYSEHLSPTFRIHIQSWACDQPINDRRIPQQNRPCRALSQFHTANSTHVSWENHQQLPSCNTCLTWAMWFTFKFKIYAESTSKSFNSKQRAENNRTKILDGHVPAWDPTIDGKSRAHLRKNAQQKISTPGILSFVSHREWNPCVINTVSEWYRVLRGIVEHQFKLIPAPLQSRFAELWWNTT